ncbi:MAG: 16S rRNA (cytosine(1402)-N(4))-methyltransferase RsmH [Candidatus Nomurabacteria bacterium]|nr:16S rRNA (cytosine(1402)-N(4))-methyltransferase RsmH [Candidatus Nomurabacteria bacterium]
MEEKINSVHKTVLLNETVDGLNLHDGSIVVDGTFGGGGHSALICKKFPKVTIIAIDQDKGAFKKAESKFQDLNCKVLFNNNNFRKIDTVLEKESIKEVHGIILDLGLSSDQLENSGRGFSFMKDEPLLMTMKENPSPEDLTVRDIVNTWGEENLANIIYGYGEEQFSKRIAKGIVEARKVAEIKTTFDLVKIIQDSVPNLYKKGRINCATKTFQALRIAVNDELGALSQGLTKGIEALKKGGRMSVISFHSLEDRIVKRFFKEKEKEGIIKIITKRPIVGSDKEIKENPRSRSAKLRIIERCQA